ncbi:hypothetical protein DM860_006039 [Cuscuta australis]|uniref:Myb-like domain-containing protein n=1 Tax=Cuscuta australis TaxID=267555 RepID=A0A328DJC0_9ASTE|nr:hypothetical protein DM860_006039 [Cuscuta australis]
MTVEDDVVGTLSKSELPTKSMKSKKKINEKLAVNPLHVLKDVRVEGGKSSERGTLCGAERRMRTTRDDTWSSSDANGVTCSKKTEKKKRKREVETNVSTMHENNRKDEQNEGTRTDDCTEGKSEKVKKKRRKKEKSVDNMGLEEKRGVGNDDSHAVSQDTNAAKDDLSVVDKGGRSGKFQKKKRKKEKMGDGLGSEENSGVENNEYGLQAVSQDKDPAKDDLSVIDKGGRLGKFQKKKRKKEKMGDGLGSEENSGVANYEDGSQAVSQDKDTAKDDLSVVDKGGRSGRFLKKKRKKEKMGDGLGSEENNEYGSQAVSQDKDTAKDDLSTEKGGQMPSIATEIAENKRKCDRKQGTITGGNAEKVKRKKKRNKKEMREDDVGSVGDGAIPFTSVDGKPAIGVQDDSSNGKKANNNRSNGKTPKSSKKKVSFSSEVEVFPVSNASESGEHRSEDGVVRGKRFSKDEDAKIKEAVYDYIEMHDLGEDGLDMVLNSKKHPELRHCWKEIGAAIPYRPYTAIYYRAQTLFRSDENHKWTEEEKELILKHQKTHGNRWKELAEELGRHRFHVKDTWRRIHLPNLKKGHWSQDEYQKLFDLVNTDMQLRISEEKKSKHGMLRDNVSWTAISDKLSTRSDSTCCAKWYTQLSSPMVAEGLWSDTDDYRLIDALYKLDATCTENVDWDNLLDHRSGDICLKRWKQMVLHIGNHAIKSFSEQVEVLAKRYCPSLIEVREVWDSKPLVP